jgi:hypothetical protein
MGLKFNFCLATRVSLQQSTGANRKSLYALLMILMPSCFTVEAPSDACPAAQEPEDAWQWGLTTPLGTKFVDVVSGLRRTPKKQRNTLATMAGGEF